MVDALAKFDGGRWFLLALMVVGLSQLVKAAFNFHRSKAQSRRDFLEVWRHDSSVDDVWLETAIRHLFGAYLPAPLIRSLLSGPQSARALFDVSQCWPLLDMNDETGQIGWRHRAHASPERRTLMRKFYGASYFLLMGAAFLVLAGAFLMQGLEQAVWLIVSLLLMATAWGCLVREERFETAARLDRWLGIP